jgi:hypothetical protein
VPAIVGQTAKISTEYEKMALCSDDEAKNVKLIPLFILPQTRDLMVISIDGIT